MTARVTDEGSVAAAVAKWKGDPTFAPGQIVNGLVICGGKKRKDGEPCGAPPLKGATRCGNHGGKSPQAQRAAERRLAEQELQNIVKTLGIRDQYPDVDPGAALLEEIRVTHAHVQWLRGQVAELSPQELTWGTVQHEEGVGPEGPIDKSTEKAEPSVWYQLYCRERDHLVKVSAAALRAGIEERKVRMAEQQGELVAVVLKQIFGALNLSAAQQQLLPTIVPQALRALNGE
ncbi:hypothetical protein ACFY5D_03600 [Paeniglutamicibacter sp. NPDC012692]|uniref:hypothetical protein n=1 Tax=Paeniglutamicibacter sp. NPDC012692 TaxID=3364388 RepID=UPI0036C4D3B3